MSNSSNLKELMSDYTQDILNYSSQDVLFRLIHSDEKEILVRILEEGFGQEFLDVKEDYIKSLVNESNIYLVLKNGLYIGTFEMKNNDVLSSFCIVPNYQGQGIGTAILKKLKLKHRHLTALGETPKSGRLYQKLLIPIVSPTESFSESTCPPNLQM